MNNISRKISAILSVLFFCFIISCYRQDSSYGKTRLTVFYASSFSPLLSYLRKDAEKTLGVELVTEPSGSQTAARKITELGRECDLLVLADNILFKKITQGKCRWRIDFCTDEVVLAVGIRAQRTDEAERDWVRVLLGGNVILGRVDENLAPIGYRTLMVWKLKELAGYEGLTEALKAKSGKIVDDAASLAALLSAGDIEYGFLYKSTCMAYDIRYIPLEKNINLGSPDINYSKAEISFRESGSLDTGMITIKGGMAVNSLSIPENAINRDKAISFIRYFLIEKQKVLKSHGFVAFKPRFYGSVEDFKPFKNFVEHAGEF